MRHLLLVTVLLALALTAVHGDVNFGAYAKSIGMGGSGLAIIDDPIVSGAINPAAYAVKNPKLRLLFPSIDYRFEGTSLSELRSISDNVRNTSGNNAVEIARQLGEEDAMIELDGATGLALGTFVVTVDGQANVNLNPSTKFKSWANDPSSVDWTGYVDSETGAANVSALQADYYADVTGQLVTSMPAVGFGWKPRGQKAVNLGVRVKAMHSSVRRQRVVVSDATNNGTVDAPDVALTLDSTTQPGAVDLVEDSGLGVDFGLIYQTPNPRMQFTTALVVNNLLVPKLNAVRIDRMVSAGAAVRLSSAFLVSADLVNINQAYDQDMRFRMGAEMRLKKWLALRAGYGGGNITYGFGIKGYDFAFARHTPFVIGRLWKF